MKQHIFLIDADNTLFPVGEQAIPKETTKCIKHAQKNGHIFTICTGRSLRDVKKIKGVKYFNYIAALTGTEIYDVKKKSIVRYSQTLNVNSVKKLVEYCEKKGFVWTYKTNKSENSVFKIKKGSIFSAKKVSYSSFETDLLNEQVTQLLINTKVNKKVVEQFPDFKFIVMPGGYTDVLKIDVSKGQAVEFFKGGFPKSKIIAIGDAENDVGMFKKADLAIAMQNATNAVKVKADKVTKSVQENGVVSAIRDVLKF